MPRLTAEEEEEEEELAVGIWLWRSWPWGRCGADGDALRAGGRLAGVRGAATRSLPAATGQDACTRDEEAPSNVGEGLGQQGDGRGTCRRWWTWRFRGRCWTWRSWRFCGAEGTARRVWGGGRNIFNNLHLSSRTANASYRLNGDVRQTNNPTS